MAQTKSKAKPKSRKESAPRSAKSKAAKSSSKSKAAKSSASKSSASKSKASKAKSKATSSKSRSSSNGASASKASSKSRSRKSPSSNGSSSRHSNVEAVRNAVGDVGGKVGGKAKSAGKTVGKAASKAKVPLVAGGAAIAGAGGMALAASKKGRRSGLGKAIARRPKVSSKDVARAARGVGNFSAQVSEIAGGLESAAGGQNGKHRSPIEVVLQGLTARR